MFSAIFVDRPRLAIVIALITTIAGFVSLFVIPLAQYPNTVPPQVQVTTMYHGANSGVVEATVAQAIEAQVVGVDKMIYMKSVSGDDGSYTLICSFELGTDPDINAVNVNNRVQIALPSLPEEVQRQGVTVKKKSSALLGVVAVYSPNGTYDPLFLSNYVTINLPHGANAIATLKAVKGRLSELQKRFPDDLTWKVTYDPTLFVTDTIHEVQKTLIEAFVLVVLVVYLFLGSLRATLIPTLAVPVSLIGTFIVLNAIGYSANTVSLLAIVLAIGIVVDDAIVVVENVERIMEEHPELSPG